MPRAVWKYDVEIDGEQHAVDLVWPTRILHVDQQKLGFLTFWAETETEDRPAESRLFQVFATGEELPKLTRVKHHGTVVADSGLVWHLYEMRVQD